jgi:hypothetical protein
LKIHLNYLLNIGSCYNKRILIKYIYLLSNQIQHILTSEKASIWFFQPVTLYIVATPSSEVSGYSTGTDV